jgi:hypothetical protein
MRQEETSKERSNNKGKKDGIQLEENKERKKE